MGTQKGMFDSAEAFEAYATIDAAHFCLKKVAEAPGSLKKRTKESLDLFKTILKSQQFLGADTANTKLAIAACERLLNPTPTVD